jgi:uncharacterized OB-fold protein
MKLDDIYLEYDNKFRENKLPYIKCKNCGHKYYYPRAICPECNSGDIEILESSGNGEIYSYTEINGNIFGIVSLEEGFKLYMDISGKNIKTGENVKIMFKLYKDKLLPYATRP